MLRDWNLPFRALVDAAPDGIVVCDPAGLLVLLNREAERMFGYKHEELLGQPLEVLIPDEVRARHRHHVAAYTAAPRVRAMGSKLDLYGRRKDGSQLPVEVSLSPVTSERGTLIIAGIREVSQRLELERDKQQMMGYLLSAVEAVQEAFLLFDPRDRVIMVNRAARGLLGPLGDAPVAGRTLEELLRATIQAGTYDLQGESPDAWFTRWMDYHRSPSGTRDARTSDGRFLRITARKTADHGTVTTIADISEDVKRAAQLEEARHLAEAASAAKSEFLSSMSHELRTPLNAILGFTQLLQLDRKQPLSARQLERLQHVMRSGEHLLRLIDDVLDLSHIEAGRLTISSEPVAVADVLAEVVHVLEPMAARAGIQVAINTVDGHPPRVVADRTRLAQILMNFGSNAIKYSKPEGHLWLCTEAVGDMLRITVRDDGIGIPEEKRDKIFEPFQRAGQEAGPIEGTGIGLTICKRLVELMRGSIGFTSEAGRGSEFWLELPIYRMRTADMAVPHAPSSASWRLAEGQLRHTVVYVEDNPSNIAFMRDIFSELPSVELLTAASAELGLDMIRAHRPKAVIMDINLPGMSGLEAVKRLRDWPETRQIPIIGLSAAALIKDKARAQEAGFRHYFTKPVKVDELMQALEELLEQE